MTASTPIWQKPASIELLRQGSEKTVMAHLGMELLELGPDFIRGRVPVDSRTHQPMGLLHGGVSVVLAETLGSIGAQLASPEGHQAVGLEINANHLRAVKTGWVEGIARPFYLGRSTQVWQIEMRDTATGEMNCISRFTAAILAPRPAKTAQA